MADFDVFLSHNHKDKPAVRALGEALRDRGLRVWLDEWELTPGRPWQEALEEVLETVRTVAVLVGKDGLGPWEIPEMRVALAEYVERRLPVIPVLLPGAARKPDLPLFLKLFTWVDLRGGLDEEGLDRLQWGITGRKVERGGRPAATGRAALSRRRWAWWERVPSSEPAIDRTAALPPAVFSAEGFDPEDSAGFFAGVSRFEDPRLAGVPFAVDDAVDLAHLFGVELGLVRPGRIVLALAGEPGKEGSRGRLDSLLRAGATRRTAGLTELYDGLDRQSRTAGERGLLVASFATHGFSDQGRDFLVAANSLRRRIRLTGLAVDALFDDVGRSPAPRRLVLVDACRERLTAGTRGDGPGEAPAPMSSSFARAIAGASGQAVLAAATPGGFAYDDFDRRNGVFTATLLDGLRGRAPADERGLVTVRTLAGWTQKQVAAWARANYPEHVASAGISQKLEGDAADMPLTTGIGKT